MSILGKIYKKIGKVINICCIDGQITLNKTNDDLYKKTTLIYKLDLWFCKYVGYNDKNDIESTPIQSN